MSGVRKYIVWSAKGCEGERIGLRAPRLHKDWPTAEWWIATHNAPGICRDFAPRMAGEGPQYPFGGEGLEGIISQREYLPPWLSSLSFCLLDPPEADSWRKSLIVWPSGSTHARRIWSVTFLSCRKERKHFPFFFVWFSYYGLCISFLGHRLDCFINFTDEVITASPMIVTERS